MFNNFNNNINNQPQTIFNQENNNIVDESFSMDYGDTYQKQMFFNDNNLNETILEQKMKNARNMGGNPNNNFYLMNQYENINEFDDDLNITIQDRKQEDYLKMRRMPSFTENEYLTIKKSVGKDLLEIQNYLLIRLNEYNKFDANKKIGPLLPLCYLIENNYQFKSEKKSMMQEKYDRLKYHIFNFRPIYSDGNCFYRAVMFRYIELLILHKKTNYIKALIVDIHKSFQTSEIRDRLFIGKEYLNPKLIIQVMITILELIENNRFIDAYLAFYKAILFSKIFDYSLVLYLRYIIYSYIKENEKKLYLESFPVLIGNLLPLTYEKDDYFYFKPFYENNLLKMFTYPEKIIIYLTPFVLGINFNIVLFEDKENEVVKHLGFSGDNGLNLNDSIYLLFRNGKFENIFTYEDNQKYNFIYNFFRNDLKAKYIKIDNSVLKGQYIPIKNNFNNINNSNTKIEKKPNSIYGDQLYKNKQKNEMNKNIYQSQMIPNNNMINNQNNGMPNMNYGYNTQYNNNQYNNWNNCNYNNEKLGLENENDKSYEGFTYSDGKYSYKNSHNQMQLSKSLNEPIPNNNQFNQNYPNLQEIQNNNINNNYQNQYNSEDNRPKTDIYGYKNQGIYNLNPVIFDKSQNIYSVAQNYNNMNNNNNNNINMINNNQCFNQNQNNMNSQCICKMCSAPHSGLKNINNICPNCFMNEIINQCKYFYVNYLQAVTKLENANTITKVEFENLFLKKVHINYDNKPYNIYQAIDEFNTPKINAKFDFNHTLKKIILDMKQQICLYCYAPVQNIELKFPCGCNFCSYYHLNLFMNEKVQNRITHDYKCFCSFKYKPNKVFEMCNLLYNKKIFKNFNFFIDTLNAIFSKICFKCGCEKGNLVFVDIEGFCPNKFNHFICENCIKKDNTNYVECTICKVQHKYMLNDF